MHNFVLSTSKDCHEYVEKSDLLRDYSSVNLGLEAVDLEVTSILNADKSETDAPTKVRVDL